MDNLFLGLEKFGINLKDKEVKIFEDEKTDAKQKVKSGPVVHEEKEFILDKNIKCPICDNIFKTKILKSGRAKRLESDEDLRPKYKDFDGNKYGVVLCTKCGYAALDRYFKPLPSVQEKLVKEKITSKFKADQYNSTAEVYDYEMALERYKMALLNTIVKKGKTSEKAYTCLKIAWVLRGKAENLDTKDPSYAQKKAECEKEETAFLKNALEGFVKAVSTENFPICGMDESTIDYLISVLAMRFGKYDMASKTISNILTSAGANKRIKEKAHDLKDELLKKMKDSKK